MRRNRSITTILLLFLSHRASPFVRCLALHTHPISRRGGEISADMPIMPMLRLRRRGGGDGPNTPLHAIDGRTEATALHQSTDSNYDTIASVLDSSVQPSTRAKHKFSGKNVLITGASGGLGRSLAHQLAKCDVSTLILSARSVDKLEVVAKECRSIASTAAASSDATRVEYIKCDLSDTDSVSNLGSTAIQLCSDRASGTVDVLVNNGGISSRGDFVDTLPEVDDRLMQVNFLSGARLAKTIVPGMIENGNGCIIWISSVQGLLGIPSRTSYAASKFAVQGYCEALRAEVAGNGVGVHVASPGYIKTELSMSAVTGDGTSYGKMDDTTANGADPNEVAVTVLDKVAGGGSSDFVVAAGFSAKVAIWLRLLAPGILEKMLAKRYEKSKK
mmetsp:Transcript_7036/g.13765  ORF Transcript_7036/g.13765 Transcript_7036/m.13765 type:complete len:389 (+) Transcript_7036:236-1402(+)